MLNETRSRLSILSIMNDDGFGKFFHDTTLHSRNIMGSGAYLFVCVVSGARLVLEVVSYVARVKKCCKGAHGVCAVWDGCTAKKETGGDAEFWLPKTGVFDIEKKGDF